MHDCTRGVTKHGNRLAYVLTPGEEGGQPIRAASLLAALRANGVQCRGFDLSLQDFPLGSGEVTDVVVDVPDFPAVTQVPDIARKIREAFPHATLVYSGSYAALNAERLETAYGGQVLRGNAEEALLKDLFSISPPSRKRRDSYLPDRSDFPALAAYPRAAATTPRGAGDGKLQGNVELSRGCHHLCSYCSVFALYGGRQELINPAVVRADVDQLVEMGAEHLFFVDADFFSFRRVAAKLLGEIHKRHPSLTVEITTRVDHIHEMANVLPTLAERGLVRITSSLEFPRDDVLSLIDKGFSWSDVESSIDIVKSAGIELNPTFILFNPWTRVEDVAEVRDFLARTGLEASTDPVQMRTRLLLYKGSPLLQHPDIRSLQLFEKEFHHDWTHSDQAVETLYRQLYEATKDSGMARCCVRC